MLAKISIDLFIKHWNSQPQLKNLESTCLENITCIIYNYTIIHLKICTHTQVMFKYRKYSFNPNFTEGSHAAGKAFGIFLLALTWNFNDPSLSYKGYNVVHSTSYYKASVCQGDNSFNAMLWWEWKAAKPVSSCSQRC